MFACGSGLGNEAVFPAVTGKTIYLTISQFMYNDEDEDITDLIDNNYVNLTIVP